MPVRRIAPIAVLVLSLGSGCALIGEGPAHIGGHATLDQAAAAARPDSAKKQRRLDVGDRATTWSETEVSVSRSDLTAQGGAGPIDAPAAKPSLAGGVLSVIAGAGAMGGGRYDGFGDFGLEIGQFVGPRWRFDVLGSVSPTTFASQSIAGQSFENEVDLNLEISGRYYLTAARTFLGAYPVAGVRFGTLFWDYDQPVPIVEDGVRKTVDSDHINHFSVFGGFGVSLMQTRHLHCGLQFTGGARFYSWDTSEGFSNTLFPPAGYVLGRLETSLKF
jgi:hypothetical protein